MSICRGGGERTGFILFLSPISPQGWDGSHRELGGKEGTGADRFRRTISPQGALGGVGGHLRI